MSDPDVGTDTSGVAFTGAPQPGARYSPTPPSPGLDPRVFEAQLRHNERLAAQTGDMMHTTLLNAARSYRWVSRMNMAMFAMGLVLFGGGAIYGVVSGTDSVLPLATAGLGAGTFIALFFTGAITKTQNALSDLVQVEVAFMQWFSQMGVWHQYAGVPDPKTGEPDPDRIERASKGMQDRSTTTIELLQRYAEGRTKNR